MSKFIERFVKDEQGATAIEYGLICCLISVAILAVLQSIGTSLQSTFSSVNGAMTSH